MFLLSGVEDVVLEFRKNNRGHWVYNVRGNGIMHEYVPEGYRVRSANHYQKYIRFRNRQQRDITTT